MCTVVLYHILHMKFIYVDNHVFVRYYSSVETIEPSKADKAGRVQARQEANHEKLQKVCRRG